MSKNNDREEKNKSFFRGILETIKVIVMALFLSALIVQVVRPTRVSGLSMYPSLNDRDYLIVNRISRFSQLDRGDIVIFDTDLPVQNPIETESIIQKTVDFVLQDNRNGKDLVKRVIGVPGDKIKIKNGVVTVNGEKISEPYVSKGNITEGEIDTIVPEGHYFVMGDNRKVSFDSRYQKVGMIPQSKIIGTVLFRVLPFDTFGTVQ